MFVPISDPVLVLPNSLFQGLGCFSLVDFVTFPARDPIDNVFPVHQVLPGFHPRQSVLRSLKAGNIPTTEGEPRGRPMTEGEAQGESHDGGEAQRGERRRDPNVFRIRFPYVKGLSERLQRVCHTFGILPAFKGGRSLRDRLTRVKTRQDLMDRKNVVYGIPCRECDEIYKGETSQPLKKRIWQHKNGVRNGDEHSAIFKHVQRTGHEIEWDSTYIISYETAEGRRLTKEGVAIKYGPGPMEGNVGRDISETWRSLASKIS